MHEQSLTQANENQSFQDHQIITLGKGAILGITGLAFRTGLTYLYTYLIIRRIGSESYGIFAIALSLTAIGMILAESGLNLSTIHFTVRSIHNNPLNSDVRTPLVRSLTLGFMMSLITLIAFWLLSPWIARQIYQEPDLSGLIRLQALGLPLFTAGNLLISFTQSFKDIRYRFWMRDVLQPVSEAAFGMLFLSLGYGINGLGLAFIAGSALFCTGSVLSVRKFLPVGKSRRQIIPYREIFSFSAPLFVSRILGTLYIRIPHLMLGALAGFQLSGIFNVAWDISRFGTFFLLAFSGIVSPMVAEVINQGNTPRLRELYSLSTRWLLIISLPLIGVMFLGAAPFMGLFGDEFRAGYVVLIILAAGQMINIGVGNTDNIIVMAGRTRLDMLNNLLGLLFVVGLSYTLIPRYQLVGAGLAQALTIALINLLKLIEIWLLLKVQPFDHTFLKPVASVFLAAIPALVVEKFITTQSNLIQVLVLLMVFMLAYMFSLMLLRLEPADAMILRSLVSTLGIKKSSASRIRGGN